MNQDVQTVPHKPDAITIFKNNIARQEREFRAALPAHIPVERFVRVLTTAVVNNPDLLAADRRSLFLGALRAAQDGLLPDGREGALVVFGGSIQWMPMIAGILKKIRNSGELLSIAAYVAYSNDDFSYELGDEEKICHRPALDDRGKPRLVYAIAKTKDGGIYREIMTIADVEKVRAVSRAKNNGPWVSWWDEMARKTVLRRLSKRLPMSSDLDDFLRRDYDIEGDRADAGSVTHLASRILAETPQDRLTADLDAIATGNNGDIMIEDTAADPSHGSLDAEVKDAGVTVPPATAPASDPAVERVLDAGRGAATNGKDKYMRWENNLSASDFERIKPHIKELRKGAGAPEWTGA